MIAKVNKQQNELIVIPKTLKELCLIGNNCKRIELYFEVKINPARLNATFKCFK